MSNQRELPHSEQILTTKFTIIEYIREIDYGVCEELLQYIVTGKENECSNKMTLYKVCSKLCFLSKLVYKNNRNIIVKLVPKKYKELLFDGYLETSDEIVLYISDKLTILHGQSDHLSRRFRSLISERYGR